MTDSSEKSVHDKDDRVTAARLLVANIIVTTLAKNIKRSGNAALAARIMTTRKNEWKVLSQFTISDGILAPLTLHLYLARVCTGYHIDIPIPPGYEKSMREKFAIFREAVKSFWEEWFVSLPEDMKSEIPALKLTETAFYWENRSGPHTPRYDMRNWVWTGIAYHYTDKKGDKLRGAEHQ